MADVKPNYKVERQRLKMQIAQQEATIARQEYENSEMQDRIARNEENMAAAKKQIDEFRKQMENLPEK